MADRRGFVCTIHEEYVPEGPCRWCEPLPEAPVRHTWAPFYGDVTATAPAFNALMDVGGINPVVRGAPPSACRTCIVARLGGWSCRTHGKPWEASTFARGVMDAALASGSTPAGALQSAHDALMLTAAMTCQHELVPMPNHAAHRCLRCGLARPYGSLAMVPAPTNAGMIEEV